MKRFAALILLAATVALGQVPCKHDPVCDTNAQQAYDYMQARFGNSDFADELWIENGYTSAYRIRLERREHAFEQIYKWAQALPPDQRSAWEGVLDAYMDGAKAAYEEWHTHAVMHEMEAYQKHQRECEEAARHAAKLPTPPAEYAK